MSRAWVVAWLEMDENNTDVQMVHTYSEDYATRLINYLEANWYEHKWCRMNNASFTGDVIGHLKGTSKVVKEVFGK